MFKKIGPGVLIASAFIGPGTVTACTLAGAGFGYALLWAMLLSILATMVLQEMSARLGIVSQKGLADAITSEIKRPLWRNSVLGITLMAIVVGNAAYESGNIGGGTLGMQALFGEGGKTVYPLIIGAIAFLLLFWGNYKSLEKIFVSLVLVMSLSFMVTAILTWPDIQNVLKGMFVPTVPEDSILTIIALVGTTVVPYNLFLHASLVNEKWKSPNNLRDAQRDTILAIGVGGLVSLSIIISAAQMQGREIMNILDLAEGLRPLYGEWARYCMGVGMLAAGITSAITAPLAAAYVANSCFGWNAGLKDFRFRMVWIFILSIGVCFLYFDIRPIEVIKFAQVANGILLPVIAFILLWMVNSPQIMGVHKNSLWQNVLGTVITMLALALGLKSILTVIGLL
ncbi:MAG: Nramp family divalent metal transporter [Flavobacteriaceae bacterium]